MAATERGRGVTAFWLVGAISQAACPVRDTKILAILGRGRHAQTLLRVCGEPDGAGSRLNSQGKLQRHCPETITMCHVGTAW